MGLRERIGALFMGERGIYDAMWPSTDWPYNQFTFNGVQYPITGINQTLTGKREEIDSHFEGLVAGAYQRNGIVFACMLARALVFSEARFQFQRFTGGRPGDLFGTPELDILERPWAGGVTADLLSAMLTDADLAGTAFITRRASQLVRMRPTWVSIVLGSQQDPDVQAGDLDAEVLGYIYYPGGKYSGRDPVPLLRDQVAQFQFVRDPVAQYRGMSWLTPIIREIQGDTAATTHKLLFFENGATPNMVVKMGQLPGTPQVQQQAFSDWVAEFRKVEPKGWQAYKTLFLSNGADATVVGANLRQLDFKTTQGAGETRIAAAARVPPIIVGLSEGLEAATYSNYGQARRAFADLTMRPLWRNAANSLETIIRTPPGARLWYDDRDIAFLREDQKDAADIQQTKMVTVQAGITSGFKADDVVKAVEAGDIGLLIGKHTGLFSVQLQAPGSTKMPGGEVQGEQPVGAGAGPESVTVTKPNVPQLAAGRSAEVRCTNCDRLLAERATPPYRISCSRCKSVTEVLELIA